MSLVEAVAVLLARQNEIADRVATGSLMAPYLRRESQAITIVLDALDLQEAPTTTRKAPTTTRKKAKP